MTSQLLEWSGWIILVSKTVSYFIQSEEDKKKFKIFVTWMYKNTVLSDERFDSMIVNWKFSPVGPRGLAADVEVLNVNL